MLSFEKAEMMLRINVPASGAKQAFGKWSAHSRGMA
jgi:hypothetical protein